MKRTLLLLFVFASLITYSQEERDTDTTGVSFYITLGKSYPLENYLANSKSVNPLEIAIPGYFSQSFDFNCNYYIHPKIGFVAGISHFKYLLDKNVFENLHSENEESNSYLKSHRINKVNLGVVGKISINRFRIEPKLYLAHATITLDDAEVYIKDEESLYYKTYTYDYKNSSFFALAGGFNFSYTLADGKYVKLGILLETELSFQNPSYNYTVNYSNKEENYREVRDETFENSMRLFYYGFGMILHFYTY